MTKLVVGNDHIVAQWAFAITNSKPMLYNMAVGIANSDDHLCGAFMFTGYNGSDMEVHYYGPGTLKRRILKDIFIFALKVFRVNRLTVRTRKESMSRGVKKLGSMRRVYGPTDSDHDKAEQWVFFRERMEQIAGLKGD
jgi:hypothetical protein